MEGRQANDYEQGDEGKGGVSNGKHHGTLLVYLNRLESVLSKWSLSQISMSPQ